MGWSAEVWETRQSALWRTGRVVASALTGRFREQPTRWLDRAIRLPVVGTPPSPVTARRAWAPRERLRHDPRWKGPGARDRPLQEWGESLGCRSRWSSFLGRTGRFTLGALAAPVWVPIVTPGTEVDHGDRSPAVVTSRANRFARQGFHRRDLHKTTNTRPKWTGCSLSFSPLERVRPAGS